ncbi:hypothetical protein BU15DRAFT_65340 [Melanogaster broomeanus]|nr:hypothetical protein BU15DRAFT_65340 [Melanogaster broomeanus]
MTEGLNPPTILFCSTKCDRRALEHVYRLKLAGSNDCADSLFFKEFRGALRALLAPTWPYDISSTYYAGRHVRSGKSCSHGWHKQLPVQVVAYSILLKEMVQTRSMTNKLQTRGALSATTSTGTYATKHKASMLAQNGDSDDQDRVPAQKRPKDSDTQEKRRRATQSSHKSRRGRLEMLPELNLDVLFQILTFLHPMDLLNIARTTKAFRLLLMRKSSAFVWKAALGRVEGLPACPPDLNEPQYAYLAFYPHCHLCGNVAPTIHWRLRLSLRPRPMCADPVHLGGLIPEEFLTVVARPAYASYLDIAQLDAFYKQYNEVPQDMRDEFLADRRRQVYTINEHASKCAAWHEDMLQARRDELERAKLARADSIFTRLKNVGYTSELDYFGTDLIKDIHPSIFSSTKVLTDQEWVCICGQFVRTMDKYRIRRLELAVYNPRRKLLVELYDAYARQPAPPGAAVDLLPDVVDLASFPAFDAIIKLPEGTEVNAETFKPAFEQIPTLVQEWRAGVDAQLAALVVIPGDSSTSGVAEDNFIIGKLEPAECLKLAIAVFENRFHDLIFSIDLLDHRIFNCCDRDSIASYVMPGRPWSLMDERGGYPLVKLFTGAAHVVRACGMDPRTATVEDMNKQHICLECSYCPPKTPKMNWRAAMLHVQRHRSKDRKWRDDPKREETMWYCNESYMPKTRDLARAPVKLRDHHYQKSHCTFMSMSGHGIEADGDREVGSGRSIVRRPCKPSYLVENERTRRYRYIA